jgi:ADP-ribose pyrophosphatase
MGNEHEKREHRGDEGAHGVDESNPWVTVSSVVAYSNAWITVSHDDVVRPDGQAGVYGAIHFHNRAIAIVPLDAHGNTWLVGQFRYTTNSYSWELPEGGAPFGEDLEEGARRELREETGLLAGSLTQIGSFYLSNSVTDEIAYVYVARDLTEGAPEPEGTEQLSVRKIPFVTALAMIDDGTITDGLAVTALLLAERWLRTADTP